MCAVHRCDLEQNLCDSCVVLQLKDDVMLLPVWPDGYSPVDEGWGVVPVNGRTFVTSGLCLQRWGVTRRLGSHLQ